MNSYWILKPPLQFVTIKASGEWWSETAALSYAFFFPVTLSLCRLSHIYNQKHTYVGTHAAVLNGTQSFASHFAEWVRIFVLTYLQRRQDGNLRKEMNRWKTYGPPTEPNHFSCLNIYLLASYWHLSIYRHAVYLFWWNLLNTWGQNWRHFTIHPKGIISKSRNMSVDILCPGWLKWIFSLFFCISCFHTNEQILF